MLELPKPHMEQTRVQYRHKGRDGWRVEYTISGPFSQHTTTDATTAHRMLATMKADLEGRFPNVVFV